MFCGFDLIRSDYNRHESSVMIFERCENLFPVLSNYRVRFEALAEITQRQARK
jgi:hypothetical protein